MNVLTERTNTGEDGFSSLSHPALKELCRAQGLPVTGNKGKLVEYLRQPSAYKKWPPAAGTKRKAVPNGPPAEPGLDSVAREDLGRHVTSIAKMVDADWHGCTEETAVELGEWHDKSSRYVTGALEKCVLQDGYVDVGHSVLKVVSDSWDQITKIPFRCDPEEAVTRREMASAEIQLGENQSASMRLAPTRLTAVAWPILLAKCADDPAVPDAVLLRMIKDAFDHGVANPHLPSNEEAGLVGDYHHAARVRLAALFARTGDWTTLRTSKKPHKMRRLIDRRYDGPVNRRTQHDSRPRCRL